MKRIFIFLVTVLWACASFAQSERVYTKFVDVTQRIKLKTITITDIITNLNNGDSSSNAKIPTAKAIVDFIRLKTLGGGGGGGCANCYDSIYVTPDSTTLVFFSTGSGKRDSLVMTMFANTPIDSGRINQRPASPVLGQRYYQTDELVGVYNYTPRGWQWEYPEMLYDVKFQSLTSSTIPGLAGITQNGGSFGNGTAYPLGMNESGFFNTNANTNGGSGYRINAGQSVHPFYIFNRYVVMQHRVVLSNISDASNRYVFWCGSRNLEFADGNSNSIYWRYSDTLNSGRWQLVFQDALGTTTINTSVAVDDSTIYNLVVQKEPNYIRAFVNGVKVGEATFNQPIAVTSSPILMNGAILKRSGTQNRTFFIDKIRLYEY